MVAQSGFPGPAPGNHLCARVQEFILTEGSSDGRVTLFEAAYIALVLHTGRKTTAQSRPAENVERPRAQPSVPGCSPLSGELGNVGRS